MRLLRLDIQRMPGFEKEGFAYENLSSGIHVIWGPNGSGKSTTCRAIKALLWPLAQPQISPLLLHSDWLWQGERISVVREASKQTIPSILAEKLASVSPKSYFFVLDDLFDTQENDLAQMVAQEMHGGYNLEGILESYRLPPRLGYLEASHLAKVRHELDGIAQEQSKIAEREEELTRLRKQIEEAKQAQKLLEKVDIALECLRLKGEIGEIDSRVQTLPSELALLREEDDHLLEELLRKDSKGEFEPLDLHVAKEHSAQAAEIYGDMQKLQIRIETREEEKTSLEHSLEEHARALDVTPEELLNGYSFAGRDEEESVRDGAALLLQWLAEKQDPSHFLAHIFLVGSALFLGIVSFMKTESVFLIFSMLLLLISGLLFVRPILRKKQTREQYLGLHLPAPKKWEMLEVQALLDTLRKQYLGGVDLQLHCEELRRARDTIMKLQTSKGHLQEMQKKILEIQADFFSLLPSDLGSFSPKEALFRFQARMEMQKHRQQLEQLQKRIHCFGPQPLEEFRKKLALVPEYKRLCEEKIRLEDRYHQGFLKIKDKTLLANSSEAIEEMQRALKERASLLESLQALETSITQDVHLAQASKRFSEANERVYAANVAYLEKEKEWKDHLIGQAFMRQLEERFTKEQCPEVLKISNRYFEAFSLGNYRLEAMAKEQDSHRFRIFDKRRERSVFIEEISRGAGLQLLLAVRLGYLALHEKSELRLPLFFDEVLCHVDDDRFPWIAEALIHIAKERQIFLFTCQRASLQAWESIAKEKQIAMNFIDLEEIHTHKRKERTAFPVVKKFSPKAPNDGEDLAAYAEKMGLPGIDFTLPLSEQPVWSILETSQELFAMLQRGIKTVGHLLTIFALHPKMVENPVKLLERKALLEKFLSLKKIGVSPLVLRDHLEDAVKKDILSETFLDAVDECAGSVGRNGALLIQALKEKAVKRFQTKSIESLEEHFLENGFIDTRKPLSMEEIEKELYAAASTLTPEMLATISLFVANKSSDMSSIVPSN